MFNLLLYWDDFDVVFVDVDCGIKNATNNLTICIPNNKFIGLNSEVWTSNIGTINVMNSIIISIWQIFIIMPCFRLLLDVEEEA